MTEPNTPHPKTPWHLWVVGGLMLIWNAFGAVDFAATMLRFEPYLKDFGGFTDEQIDFYLSFPWWQDMLWFIGTWGGFIGAILLVMRNKFAVPLLIASFFGALGSMVHGMMLKDPPPGMDPGIFPFIILTIAFLLAAYAWWMRKKGVLR